MSNPSPVFAPTPEALALLLRRRSVPARDLGLPGPSADQLRTLLTAAARVPDHGRLCPWWFLVLEGDARAQAGAILRAAWAARDPAPVPAKCDLEAERFSLAPVVVGVIARPRPGKHPVWEQTLSAGAVCQTLCAAATAMGFGAHWVTGWYAYDEAVRAGLGLDARDTVAGFIHLGTPTAAPEERERPDLDSILTLWRPGAAPRRGDRYDPKAES